jgi:hypothetical protein
MNLWKIVSSIGLILGIIASIISIWTFLRIGQIEEHARKARDWIIILELSEPPNGSEISGHVARIAGTADFRATAAQVQSSPKVNLSLQENRVDLVPFVRPLSEAKWWWAQSIPVVRQDGGFEGSVFLGEQGGAGIGIDFQVVILAVPKGSVSEGNKFLNLPFSYAASNTVTVKRVR